MKELKSLTLHKIILMPSTFLPPHLKRLIRGLLQRILLLQMVHVLSVVLIFSESAFMIKAGSGEAISLLFVVVVTFFDLSKLIWSKNKFVPSDHMTVLIAASNLTQAPLNI